MTCADARDRFSARADAALDAAERAALEAHLAGCAECRRDWRRFERTVELLRAVEPPRAPAGFVERVLAAAPRRPWYRRLARGLLVPWPVKLPLDAAAIVLVAVLASVVFERSPEPRQVARVPAPSVAGPRTLVAPPPPAATLLMGRVEPRAQAPADAPAAPAPAEVAALDKTRDEAAATRALAAPSRESAAKVARQPLIAAAPPPATSNEAEARLAATDRAAATREIAALVARLGGSVSPRDAGVLELSVPQARYPTLTRELARLGELRIDRAPADPAAAVRLRLRLAD